MHTHTHKHAEMRMIMHLLNTIRFPTPDTQCHSKRMLTRQIGKP